MKLFSLNEKKQLNEHALSLIDYRRTGISINHILGCPLDCIYCVRHFWNNYTQKEPKMLCSNDQILGKLLDYKYFSIPASPIQLLHKATDPFLGNVKKQLFYILEKLNSYKLNLQIILITRYKVTEKDIDFLESLMFLTINIFVTYSGIKNSIIEPLSTKEIALDTIKKISRNKKRIKLYLYWRPLVEGWNDDYNTIKHVLETSTQCDAIVYKGIIARKSNIDYIKSKNIEIAFHSEEIKKILSKSIIEKIFSIKNELNINIPIYNKTSCAISCTNQMPDYNGNFYFEKNCIFCDENQKDICTKSKYLINNKMVNNVLLKIKEDVEYKIDNNQLYIKTIDNELRLFLQHYFRIPVHFLKLTHKQWLSNYWGNYIENPTYPK